MLRTQLHPWGQRIVLLDKLPQLSLPTLIVWGSEDKILPKIQAEAALKRLPRGELVIIPDCGHIPPLERPACFVTALTQFLSNSRPI